MWEYWKRFNVRMLKKWAKEQEVILDDKLFQILHFSQIFNTEWIENLGISEIIADQLVFATNN